MGRQATPLAKITRPVPTGVIQRDPLFRRLDQARNHPVIWISGPAGSGKTTLASSYLEARALPCLWYQVDSGDADLATFFYYLGLAGKKAAPRRRRPLPALTPEYLLGIPEFSRDFFEELCRRVGSPAALVFDNCQLVEEDAPFYLALLEGLNRLPEGTHLVLLSRADPPDCFARLRANRELARIGWEDLRLTLEEFENLARRQGVEDPSAEELRVLHQRVDGWVAGLQLLLETARTQRVAPRELAEGAPEFLFEYFASEAFDCLEEETREFLLQTSVLPSMTPRLADALTGCTRSAHILAALHRRNYFTERRPRPELSYQYHPLFREFLAARAATRLAAEDLAALQRRAAQLLLEAGRVEEAAGLLEQAADWEGLTGLALAHAASLMQQGRNQVLGDWIRSLPAEHVEAHPGLQLWLGSSHMPMNPPEAYRCYQRSFELFREAKDSIGSLLAWSGAVDSIVWGFADFHELKPWARLLAELIPGPEALPPGPIGARVAASLYAALVTSQPAHPDLALWEKAALATTRNSDDPIARMQTLYQVHATACYRGDPSLLEAAITAIRQETRPGSPPFARIMAIHAEILYELNLCHYKEGLQAAEKGFELARTTGVHVLDYHMMGFAVYAPLALGRRQLAHHHHERMGELLASMPLWDQSFYHYLSARLALDEGDLSKAGAVMQLVLEQVEALGHAYPLAITHLILAFIAHEQGDGATAKRRLELARQVAQENRIFAVLPGCLATEAHFLLSRGEEKAGLDALRKALTAVARRGIPYFVRRDVVAALCSRALAAGIETEFVVELIRRLDLTPPSDTLQAEAWPWPLRIHTPRPLRAAARRRAAALLGQGPAKAARAAPGSRRPGRQRGRRDPPQRSALARRRRGPGASLLRHEPAPAAKAARRERRHRAPRGPRQLERAPLLARRVGRGAPARPRRGGLEGERGRRPARERVSRGAHPPGPRPLPGRLPGGPRPGGLADSPARAPAQPLHARRRGPGEPSRTSPALGRGHRVLRARPRDRSPRRVFVPTPHAVPGRARPARRGARDLRPLSRASRAGLRRGALPGDGDAPQAAHARATARGRHRVRVGMT